MLWRWLGCFWVIAAPAWAEALDSAAKFAIEGDTLVYDTESAFADDDGEIETGDIDVFLARLTGQPEIRVLELNSGGGSIFAAEEIARIVLDFELDTIVVGECTSACVTVFLAGASRSMTLGSKIGFHQRYWSASAAEDYYEKWRETERWDTPFEFASWVYRDTQGEVYEELIYMIERGVDPVFAISTKRLPTSGAWYPSRRELMEAGVLRD